MTILMNRSHNQPYPPMYHTPQSNSPASVASPTGTDHRSVYSTQQMPQQIYGYPQSYPLPTPQAQYQPHPQHMATQPLLMSQSGPHATHPGVGPMPSPRAKLPQNPLGRPNHTVPSPNTNTGLVLNPGGNNSGLHHGQGSLSGSSVNPSAAPGPIPATTPLVVRQDNNGVQWIAFEYSRDRVKMEYTIRCDVESVNVDALPQDFKTENCVYPRACCSKDQYRGNRLVYETECNTVGWALAELNPCLRGKRGLIQRAVDSWRNSNQDPRLRSRRVRRMAKLNNRKAVHANQVNTMNSTSPVHSVGGLGMKPAAASMMHSQQSGSMHHHHHHHHQHQDPSAGHEEDMGAMLQQHHAHQSAFGSTAGLVGVTSHPHLAAAQHGAARTSSGGQMSPTGVPDDFSNSHHHHHHHHAAAGSADVRARNVYQPYPASYPTEPGTSASMPPSMHDALDGNLGGPSATSAGPSNTTVATIPQAALTAPATSNISLFGDIPEHKRRKFILVDDPHRGARVRVRVMLDQVEMDEIPDSYRKTNSVYPRSYYARQMQSPPPSSATVVQSTIQIPLMDGSSLDISTPLPSKSKKEKETALNDLGYRMSWSQSRVFAGRTMFLQRALDAYRNKMRSSMMAAGQEVTSIAPHLETRVGKRKWLERNRRSKSL